MSKNSYCETPHSGVAKQYCIMYYTNGHAIIYSLTNVYVKILLLKDDILLVIVTLDGRLFHNRGAAFVKDLPPYGHSIDLGVTS